MWPLSRILYPLILAAGSRFRLSQRLPTQPTPHTQEEFVAGLTCAVHAPLREQSRALEHLYGPGGIHGGDGGEGGGRGQDGLPPCTPTAPETRPLWARPDGVLLAALRKQGPALVGVPSKVQKWHGLIPAQAEQHTVQLAASSSSLLSPIKSVSGKAAVPPHCGGAAGDVKTVGNSKAAVTPAEYTRPIIAPAAGPPRGRACASAVEHARGGCKTAI